MNHFRPLGNGQSALHDFWWIAYSFPTLTSGSTLIMKHLSIPFWGWLLLINNACQKENPPVLPVINVVSPTGYRPVVDTNFEFTLSLLQISADEVSVDYVTKDGTAVAGVDYFFVAGTAIIPPGSLTTTVKVKVKADSLRGEVKTFYLQLSAARNCTIETKDAIGEIDDTNGFYLPVNNAGYSTPSSYPSYTLIWSDEFNAKTIDKTNWSFETGNNGWGTQELEFYTDRSQNAFVSSGSLILEARKEKYFGADYTSARITTKSKKELKYGRIDIRAKVPVPNGIMSSLRMLGSNIDEVGWPTCGEIDIMQLPHLENVIYNTLHWSDSLSKPHQFGINQSLGTVTENTFHVFSVVWDSTNIDMYIDDRMTFRMSTDKSLPFNNNYFFTFNLAVGGDWPGTPDDNAIFPQRLIVDYVRVFQ